MQTKNSSKKTIRASTFTNIFVSELEERYIYALIISKSISYPCFIHVFLVWIRSENQLKLFINEVNQKYHSTKFDFRCSKDRNKFLDILVYVDHNKNLQNWTLHKKPTDHQNYLHVRSVHSHSPNNGIT